MADQISALAYGVSEETKAYLLIHSLELAANLDIPDGARAGAVRAFVKGCAHNDYAQALLPMVKTYWSKKDLWDVRKALLIMFNESVDAAWKQWPHNDTIPAGKEREGLERFLARGTTLAQEMRLRVA